MNVSTALRLTVALLPLAAMGCAAIDQYVDPIYDVRGSRVMVVPFRKGNHWHYESKEGNSLGQAVEAAMQNECGGLEAIRNRPIQGEIRMDLSEEIDWVDYGRRAGVEYLIVGEIESLRYDNPDLVGMYQGKIRVRYQVWDIEAGELGYARQLEHQVPENPDAGQVYISFEQSRHEVEAALMASTGKKIAGHLCGFSYDGLTPPR